MANSKTPEVSTFGDKANKMRNSLGAGMVQEASPRQLIKIEDHTNLDQCSKNPSRSESQESRYKIEHLGTKYHIFKKNNEI